MDPMIACWEQEFIHSRTQESAREIALGSPSRWEGDTIKTGEEVRFSSAESY